MLTSGPASRGRRRYGWLNAVVNGVAVVTYPLSRSNDVVTILRDETYMSVDDIHSTSFGSPKWWGILTGAETPGDMQP